MPMKIILFISLLLVSCHCQAQNSLDVAYVKTTGDSWQLIDPTGKILADSLFEQEPMAVLQCSEGMVITAKAGKYGFISLVDTTVIANRFDTVTAFKSGRAAVSINSKWYWLTRNGKLGNKVLTPEELTIHMQPAASDIAPICKDGYCLVETDSFTNCKGPDGTLLLAQNDLFTAPWNDVNSFIIDRILKYKVMISKTCSCDKLTNYYGFINRQGQWVIDADFEQADIFSYGLASVGIGAEGMQHYGYIDTNGDWKIQPIYKEAGRFLRIRLK
jgi:hypothetical protein